MNRAELQQLSRDRLADAKALLAAKRWAAGYYLLGYAVECALKACIARLMKAEEFPDKGFAEKCWTHNLAQLVTQAALKDALLAACAADAELSDNWGIVKDWNEASRYERTAKPRALALYAAVTNSKHGVLPWMRSRW